MLETRSGRFPLGQLKKLTSQEYLSRERITSRIPGGSGGFALKEAASLLGIKEIRALLTAISFKPTSLFGGTPFVALSTDNKANSKRLVLALEQKLAHAVVDLALGRHRSPSNAFRRTALTHGEQGALLYVLDRAGGDWLAGGNPPFVMRGFLADRDQVADYLHGAPDWQLLCRLKGADLDGLICLWFREPVPPPTRLPAVDPNQARSLEWPLNLSVQVGSTRLSLDDLAHLAIGDLVVLDEWSHPKFAGDGFSDLLRCGRWQKAGRWLDGRRLQVTTRECKGSPMDTKLYQDTDTPVVLDPPTSDDAGEMEITVRVEVGSLKMPLNKALGLVPGRILRLDREVGSAVVLKVGDKLIAHGELVEHEGLMAVEIKDTP